MGRRVLGMSRTSPQARWCHAVSIFVIISAIIFQAVEVQSQLTSDEIAILVERHNYYRHPARLLIPTTPALPKIAWDPILAARAQAFLEECTGAHSNQTYRANVQSGCPSGPMFKWVGENRAWGPAMTAGLACDLWANERVDYVFANIKCTVGKVCGHWTQMVWRTSTFVGCGKKLCGNDIQILCQYGPAGNAGGVLPYIPCTLNCPTEAGVDTPCGAQSPPPPPPPPPATPPPATPPPATPPPATPPPATPPPATPPPATPPPATPLPPPPSPPARPSPPPATPPAKPAAPKAPPARPAPARPAPRPPVAPPRAPTAPTRPAAAPTRGATEPTVVATEPPSEVPPAVVATLEPAPVSVAVEPSIVVAADPSPSPLELKPRHWQTQALLRGAHSGDRCGNGKIDDTDEECDEPTTGTYSCTILGYVGGQLRCDEDCRWDTQACVEDERNDDLDAGTHI